MDESRATDGITYFKESEMKPVLQYLKSNALLIALLGVVGYQQVMLSQLVTEGKWDSMILKNPRERCVRGGHRILMYDDIGIAGSVAPQRICAYDGEKIKIPSAYEQNAYLVGMP